MMKGTTKGLPVILSTPTTNPIPPKKPDPSWRDLPGQVEVAREETVAWLKQSLIDLSSWVWDGILQSLDILLPTAAAIGVLWWMCPFLPKPERGAKLTGLSLLLLMFYAMARGM